MTTQPASPDTRTESASSHAQALPQVQPGPLPPGQHPRLLITPQRLALLRDAIAAADHDQPTALSQAFATLKHRVDNRLIEKEERRGSNWNYARAYMANASAFLYLITGERHYAQLAYDTLCKVHDEPDPDLRLIHQGYGLSRSTVGLGFAFAYDWCSRAWDDDQRQHIEHWINRGLDAWTEFHHHNFGGEGGSNWLGVCRAGELILMLAAGQEKARAERFAFLKKELRRHVTAGYGPMGVTQEGVGYCAYAGIYLLPAWYCLQSIGDHELDGVYEPVAWWKQIMFTGTFACTDEPVKRRHLQSGVAHEGINDEGWTSLLLRDVPPAMLPEYLWFYDRNMGLSSPAEPHRRFDWRRQGLLWAMLFYPEAVQPRDPSAAIGVSAHDARQGLCYFRNRWRDEDDLLLSISAQNKLESRGWRQPETMAINLFAYGARFIAGPGKDREHDKLSTLLVDGVCRRDRHRRYDTGRLLAYEPSDEGGYVIVDGGQQYANLGLDHTRRHLRVRFFEEQRPAASTAARDELENAGDPRFDDQRAAEDQHTQIAGLVAVYDDARGRDPHTFIWNANIGALGHDRIIAVADHEAGVPCFQLTSERDAWVKGWVLSPGDATIHTTEHRLQIETAGRSVRFLIAMLVGKGQPPVSRVVGSGMSAVLHVAGQRIGYSATLGRISFGA